MALKSKNKQTNKQTKQPLWRSWQFPLWLSRLQAQLESMKMRVQSLTSFGGLRSGIAVSCGEGCRRWWLWCRLVATAPIWPLAWEPPYAEGAGLEKAKRQKTKTEMVSASYVHPEDYVKDSSIPLIIFLFLLGENSWHSIMEFSPLHVNLDLSAKDICWTFAIGIVGDSRVSGTTVESLLFFFCFALSWAAPSAYGGSQARSYSHRPTPQLTATPDP